LRRDERINRVKIILKEVETLPQLVALLQEGVRYGEFHEVDTCAFTAFGVDYEEYFVIGYVGLRPADLVGEDIRGGDNHEPFILPVARIESHGSELLGVKAVKLTPESGVMELLGEHGKSLGTWVRIRIIIPS
jgi:hypothetical protein